MNLIRKLLALAFAAGTISAAVAQPDVGVSIHINQPGIYGRINIGDVPRPALVLPQPVIIAPASRVVARQPIYLYVPAAHQQSWGRYCNRYAACGQPVYFVREDWVRERYEHEHPGWNRGRHRGWDKHEERRDDREGHGHGHGKKDKHGRDD